MVLYLYLRLYVLDLKGETGNSQGMNQVQQKVGITQKGSNKQEEDPSLIPDHVKELLYQKDHEIMELMNENERLKDKVQKLAKALDSMIAQKQQVLFAQNNPQQLPTATEENSSQQQTLPQSSFP